ncbi:MAG: siderophore-interacting protein [Paracoccus sp. (in: a-proteobacteria)]|uniref:siderophore-interacting protein n=1 Tax=Paracoccus sp. TaxID=267 RepID=UPI0026DF6E11|nr:siderophore-interacting protein [Paracoccus sp. (in: a-proteobacteria)]MDO5622930.1 siderophore-interacting protein [Paracoccus sp. (in: a-proteobacteria)]
MTSPNPESVEDPEGLLSQSDHMRDMDQVQMEVVAIQRPFASVARLVGRIETADPAAWLPANQAVRIEVETPAGQRPVSRIYTIRSFDAATCMAEIDLVIHDDDSPAMRWLRAARPGTRVGTIGPRQHMVPCHAPGKRSAIFADETAIPAVFAILNEWPEGAPGSLWIETAEPGAFDELPRLPGVDYHLIRRDAPAGTTSALLSAAQAAIASPEGWTLWAAGERQEMRNLRSHFRALGMARDDLRVVGYWKLGTSSSDLDRIRLQEYNRIRQQGLRLEDLDDADLPI